MLDLYVTGTASRIGKTLITAGIAAIMQSLGYKSGVYKPIQCNAITQNGFTISPDIAFIKQIEPFLITECSYIFKSFSAPILAAEVENVTITMEKIINDYQKVNKQCEVTLVDGEGGLMTPIAVNHVTSDIPKNLNIPILIIAKPNLETVNETLTTINYAKSIGLKISGVIINKFPYNTPDPDIQAIPRLIEEYSDARVVGIVDDFGIYRKFSAGILIEHILNNVDIEAIFKIKIPKLNNNF